MKIFKIDYEIIDRLGQVYSYTANILSNTQNHAVKYVQDKIKNAKINVQNVQKHMDCHGIDLKLQESISSNWNLKNIWKNIDY